LRRSIEVTNQSGHFEGLTWELILTANDRSTINHFGDFWLGPHCQKFDDVFVEERRVNQFQSGGLQVLFGVSVELGAVGIANPRGPQFHDETMQGFLR